MSTLNLQPPRVPLVDHETGIITREWYRFITDSFARQGGHNASTNTELSVDMPEDSGVAELEMYMHGVNNALAQAPSNYQFFVRDDFGQEPAQIQLQLIMETLESLQIEVRSSAEMIALQAKQIEELKQGTML